MLDAGAQIGPYKIIARRAIWVLMAQAFDTERKKLKGEAFPLTNHTNLAEVVNRPFSVSENGVLIWPG